MEDIKTFYNEVIADGRITIPELTRKLNKISIGDTVVLKTVNVYKAVKK